MVLQGLVGQFHFVVEQSDAVYCTNQDDLAYAEERGEKVLREFPIEFNNFQEEKNVSRKVLQVGKVK